MFEDIFFSRKIFCFKTHFFLIAFLLLFNSLFCSFPTSLGGIPLWNRLVFNQPLKVVGFCWEVARPPLGISLYFFFVSRKKFSLITFNYFYCRHHFVEQVPPLYYYSVTIIIIIVLFNHTLKIQFPSIKSIYSKSKRQLIVYSIIPSHQINIIMR